MPEGYIKLYRQIMDNELWKIKPYSKGQAWVELIMLANHDDADFMLGNQTIHVERGSFVTSELKLMDRWGWSKSKVRAFLMLLKCNQMVDYFSDRKKTTITIVNYSGYQDFKTAERPEKDHKKTASRPQKDTNNNDKNVKNEKKDIYGEFQNVLLSVPEYEKLQNTLGDQCQAYIDRLSGYIASKGAKYKSHYATILNWYRKDGGAKKVKASAPSFMDL